MKRIIQVFTFLIFATIHLHSQALDLVSFTSDLWAPVDIAHAGDERLFVVEKNGYIKIIQADGSINENIFLDIDDKTSSILGEQGLLSLAFDPNYNDNGRFYISYTDNNGNSVVARYERSADPDIADPDSEKILLQIDQPFINHNGSDMNFGPDGYLYISFGDGGSAGDPGDYSQNRQSLLGKILRLDVSGEDYEIPLDNPFVNDDNTLDEIWSLGWRNPWRFSFDRNNGDMYVADVGQDKWEEVSYEAAGSPGGLNFGWRCYEGFEEFNTNGCNGDYEDPVWTYFNNQTQEGCSITGGYVYRGDEFPNWQGKYIYADYCSGNIWSLSKNECDNWDNVLLLNGSNNSYTGFGENADGELFLASISSGEILKLTNTCNLETELSIEHNSCSGSLDGSIHLSDSSGSGELTILWDDGFDGLDRDSLSQGFYSFTLTDELGCFDVQCIEIIAEETIDVCDLTIPDVGICNEESISIDVSACPLPDGYQYQWYVDGQIYSEPTMEAILIIEEEGFYQLQLTNGICNSPVSNGFNVEIFEPIELEFTIDVDTFKVEPDNLSSYEWYVDGIALGENSACVIIEEASHVEVIVTDENGCIYSASIFIDSTKDPFWVNRFEANPNPFYEKIEIDLHLEESCIFTLSLYNSQGMEVWTQPFNQCNLRSQIPTENLQSGVYFLHLKDRRGQIIRKLIKK